MTTMMNPNATSFIPASHRHTPPRHAQQAPPAPAQEQEEMVIVFDNGSEGSERDLASAERCGPPRGLVLLDELRDLHRQRGRQHQPAWSRTEVFEEVRTAKDFWRVFTDDQEAQGVLLAFHYMFPHSDEEDNAGEGAKKSSNTLVPSVDDENADDDDQDPNKENGTASAAATNNSTAEVTRMQRRKRRAMMKQLHGVLSDVRRYIQLRMHPVQAQYLGTGPELFDEAGSGFNLQSALGSSRTRGALRLFHFFHPHPVQSAVGEPISFTILLGPPPASSPSAGSSPSRRAGAPARLSQASPPRLGSRGPLVSASPAAAAARARRVRALSSSSALASEDMETSVTSSSAGGAPTHAMA